MRPDDPGQTRTLTGPGPGLDQTRTLTGPGPGPDLDTVVGLWTDFT